MKTLDVWSLPEGDPKLKAFLNFNPRLLKYTKAQPETNRDPNETDRGGWRGYNRVYSHYISYLKNKPITLMEVGAHFGFGLLAWARYFPKAQIYSMEKDIAYSQSHNSLFKNYSHFERVRIEYCDSAENYSWVKLDQYFEVIIDDGSHKPKDQLLTLKNSWPYLKPGGYYFIEDISTRYYNPSSKIVELELTMLEKKGNFVEIYSHKNEGWANILADPKVWKRYGVTDKTPKKAIDSIAVIQKLEK